MKRMAMIAASALLLGRGLAAQDTTKAAAPAPAPAPAAATPSVTVVEAVVAKSVVDRQPQDTGAAFPADVSQLNCWTKVEGAGGSSIHHVWFHGDTQVGDVELQDGAGRLDRSLARRGERRGRHGVEENRLYGRSVTVLEVSNCSRTVR